MFKIVRPQANVKHDGVALASIIAASAAASMLRKQGLKTEVVQLDDKLFTLRIAA